MDKLRPEEALLIDWLIAATDVPLSVPVPSLPVFVAPRRSRRDKGVTRTPRQRWTAPPVAATARPPVRHRPVLPAPLPPTALNVGIGIRFSVDEITRHFDPPRIAALFAGLGLIVAAASRLPKGSV